MGRRKGTVCLGKLKPLWQLGDAVATLGLWGCAASEGVNSDPCPPTTKVSCC